MWGKERSGFREASLEPRRSVLGSPDMVGPAPTPLHPTDFINPREQWTLEFRPRISYRRVTFSIGPACRLARYDIFDIPPSTQLPVEPINLHMCEMDLRYGDVMKCLDRHARLNKKCGRHMVQGCGKVGGSTIQCVGCQLRCLY